MGVIANRTVRRIIARTAVVYTGVTARCRRVSAVDAKTGAGGDDFFTLGASFQCHNRFLDSVIIRSDLLYHINTELSTSLG